MSSVTLHHLESSRSERIVWLLEELGLEYTMKVYYRGPTRQAPPELKKVSPVGKAPVLEIDGQTLSESGAIVHYLLTHYHSTGLESTPTPSSTFFSHFSEGSLMLFLQGGAMVGASGSPWAKGLTGLTEEQGSGVKKYVDWFVNTYVKTNVDPQLEEVEKFLAEHPESNFSGTSDLGEGDFMIEFPINSIAYGTRKDSGFVLGPATKAWLERIRARPAWKRAMEKIKTEEEAQKRKASL